MNEHLKEVLDDMQRLPLSDEQSKIVREIFVNGGRESNVLSKKEAQKELKNGG